MSNSYQETWRVTLFKVFGIIILSVILGVIVGYVLRPFFFFVTITFGLLGANLLFFYVANKMKCPNCRESLVWKPRLIFFSGWKDKISDTCPHCDLRLTEK